jgi:hypothetical protein
MVTHEKMKILFKTKNLQKILNLLNSLSKEEIKKNTESIKTAILFILFKKRVSTNIVFNNAGRGRINNSAKSFYTATVKEFQQHVVKCIFKAMYTDAIAIKTIHEFDQFLKDSKKEICGSFKTSGGDFIEKIEYTLEYP